MDGRSALVRAVGRSDFNVIEFLLSQAADVNSIDGKGNTALMYAAQVANVAVTRSLLHGLADPNVRNSVGLSALAGAVVQSCVQTVQMLISFAADVNGHDNHGRSVLGLAVVCQQDAIAQLPCASGASGADVSEDAANQHAVLFTRTTFIHASRQGNQGYQFGQGVVEALIIVLGLLSLIWCAAWS